MLSFGAQHSSRSWVADLRFYLPYAHVQQRHRRFSFGARGDPSLRSRSRPQPPSRPGIDRFAELRKGKGFPRYAGRSLKVRSRFFI